MIVRDAHPPLIPRAVFEEAQNKRTARRDHSNCHTYRSGRGATSTYLLSGLIRCWRCGHNWQGYHTTKGRKRTDGSQVRTYYYACGGYVGKGNAVCGRAVIPQEFIETWVLEQIGGIVHGLLDNGGEKKMRRLIEQEMAGAGRDDGSELAKVHQRKADIEATIENLLDNMTATNRDFVDRRIEKLRDEMVALERQEAALAQQQDRERHAKVLVDRAFAAVRDFGRLVEAGTVDEKRTVVRAFLHSIDYDPESRSGKGHFWLLPGVGPDGQEPNPGGRGRRTDVAGNIRSRTAVGAAGTPCSLLGFRAGDTRSEKKRSATGGDASSFDMVAGGGFEPPTSGL